MDLLKDHQEFCLLILKKLNKKFLSNMENPLILSDFLTNKFESSSNQDLQILSLKGLFILITKYSFEYANYYNKLYNLIKISSPVWKSKFLWKFLSLLEVSLRTTKISNLVLSAFVKVRKN